MIRILPVILISTLVSFSATAGEEEKPIRIAEMHLTDGRTFSEVTIRKITGDGVSIIHSSGVAKIPFELLSEADIKTLGLTKEGIAKTREDNKAKGLVDATQRLETAMINATVDINFMRIDGIVLQVFPNAVLLTNPEVWSGSYESWNDPIKNVRQYLAQTKKIATCLVYCDTSRIVDGARYLGIVGESGTFTYRNTLGGTNTVRAYTSDLEAACKSHVPDNPEARAKTVAKIKAKYSQDRMIFTTPIAPEE